MLLVPLELTLTCGNHGRILEVIQLLKLIVHDLILDRHLILNRAQNRVVAQRGCSSWLVGGAIDQLEIGHMAHLLHQSRQVLRLEVLPGLPQLVKPVRLPAMVTVLAIQCSLVRAGLDFVGLAVPDPQNDLRLLLGCRFSLLVFLAFASSRLLQLQKLDLSLEILD